MEIRTLPELRDTYFKARVAMIEKLNAQGLSQKQAAPILGVSRTYLNNLIKLHGIEWRVKEWTVRKQK